MKYKLLCTDMDGTLLDDRKEISTVNREAIKLANDNGVKVVVCTGRLFVSSKFYSDLLELKTPVIASNGAYIREKDRDEVIYKCAINKKECMEILNLFRKYNIYAHFYTEDTIFADKIIYVSQKYLEYNKTIPKDVQVKVKVVEDWEKVFEEYDGKIFKAFATDENTEKIRKAKEEFKKLSKFNVVSSYDSNFEIMSKEVSKGRAVEILAGFYGINKDEIICIGDNENDLSMIEYAGLGVAMKNGSNLVKDNSNYITDTNNNNGVAKVIDKFIFNK
ncbi:Cof-type HAD-IIB family hydrolase [Haloimpatiens sp. FM7330]|uniref:Cof-type HAD-IIB family hydrolase n=1 Tax=Haloimpatiens sp. FM7330 TaxID=3298610 RepID=UPI00362891B8